MEEIRNVSSRLIFVYKPHKSTGPILLRVVGMIEVMLQGHDNSFLTFLAFEVFRLLSVVVIK
jgi:hypothetical protein